MAIMKKQLKGENLCNLSCTEQKEVIHPENDITDVLMTEETTDTISLKNWILGGDLPTGGDYPENPIVYPSLKEWLQKYYSGNVAFVLPTASASTKGGIKIGQYLTIDDEVLSVDKNSLNIPEAFTLTPASHTFDGENDKYELGGVNIFNEFEGIETENPSKYGITIRNGGTLNYNLEGDEHLVFFINPIEYVKGTIIPKNTTFYLLPVNIIKKNRESEEEVIDQNCAVTNIPTYLFEKDWNETLPASPYFIKNKPVLATVATSGSYNDLSNKPTIPAAQVQSDWNANSGMGEILHKPTLSVDRVIESEALNDGKDSDVANTLFSGNSVINLNSDNAIAALTILLDEKCPIKNITLYISKIEGTVTVKVENYPTLVCYQNQSSVTYTDNGEGTFEFSFSSDITRIDYFKIDENITLYITDYKLLTSTSNNQ